MKRQEAKSAAQIEKVIRWLGECIHFDCPICGNGPWTRAAIVEHLRGHYPFNIKAAARRIYQECPDFLEGLFRGPPAAP